MEELAKWIQLENDENSDYYIERENFDWEPVEGTKNGLKIRDGVYLPMLVKNLKIIKDMDLKSDDTFIIGFPKSGTTWVEEIAWLIQHDLDFETAKNCVHFYRVLFIDYGFPKNRLINTKSPRILKSHFSINFLPDNIAKKSKVIYVIRNPKDMLASTETFIRKVKNDEFTDSSFETLVNNFLSGKIWYGEWWKHIEGYINNPDVHIVIYENLLENPIENIKSMCKFLGKEYSDSDLVKLVSFTSFDKMKNNPSFSLSFDVLAEVGFFYKNVEFFRKGQIGNWKNIFTDELSKKVDELVEKKLKNKIEFKYFPSNSNTA